MAILFIDCYDSFTYNLVNLIQDALRVKVAVVHNDTLTVDQLYATLPAVEAVIVGPGPGHPRNKEDAGIIPELWNLPDRLRLPIFGVCFGFQSLVLTFGGEVRRLPIAQHGQYGIIHHTEDGLFAEIPQDYTVIRYHSLEAVTNDSVDLEPLAYCGDVLMAVRHKQLPYYAVQFHPESILSQNGPQLIENFWSLAREWNSKNRMQSNLPFPKFANKLFTSAKPLVKEPVNSLAPPRIRTLESRYDPLNICQYLHLTKREFTLLHSAAPPGKWTIICVLDPQTVHFRSKGNKTYVGPLRGPPEQQTIVESNDPSSTWQVIGDFMSSKIRPIETDLPFVGGIVGYITYEKACAYTWSDDFEHPTSDSSFVYVENCLLVADDGTTYVVGDLDFLDDETELSKLHNTKWDEGSLELPSVEITRPKSDEYIDKVAECQEYLRAGDSYELCLTAQTQANFTSPVIPWDLFKHLIKRNPAPYSTFMAFDDTLVGTSPERFMSWDRSGLCQFRPIKGTVKKGPHMTYEKAAGILSTPKERSENLMIVDLIRHDLGYLLSDVRCPQIMQVEEYKTVYQLVSVVEGTVKGKARTSTPGPAETEDSGDEGMFTGFDVLVQSLPPGSMTGAPKIRSVEILRHLEKQPRGLYSGVCGYWSITDNGDWSVVIRSAFRYGKEQTWRMGAGGAVVILSDPKSEFEEMETKLESALQAFEN